MIFDIYKQGQGTYTRMCSALGAAIIVGLGCLQLYGKLQAADFSLWVEIMVPAALFCVLSFWVFWLVNRPTVADFMVSAEGEMKKVSWSSRQEIIVSTFIVIVVMFIMAVLLGVTDFGFQLIFMWLFGK
jgi:preprotein translocase subunit SecE